MINARFLKDLAVAHETEFFVETRGLALRCQPNAGASLRLGLDDESFDEPSGYPSMAVLTQNRDPTDVTVLQDAAGPHRSSLIQCQDMTGPAVETVMLQIRGHLLLTYEHLVSDGANRLFLLSIRGLNDGNHGSRSHFSLRMPPESWAM